MSILDTGNLNTDESKTFIRIQIRNIYFFQTWRQINSACGVKYIFPGNNKNNLYHLKGLPRAIGKFTRLRTVSPVSAVFALLFSELFTIGNSLLTSVAFTNITRLFTLGSNHRIFTIVGGEVRAEGLVFRAVIIASAACLPAVLNSECVTLPVAARNIRTVFFIFAFVKVLLAIATCLFATSCVKILPTEVETNQQLLPWTCFSQEILTILRVILQVHYQGGEGDMEENWEEDKRPHCNCFFNELI